MGKKQPWLAIIDHSHRLPTSGGTEEEFVNLAYGLLLGRT